MAQVNSKSLTFTKKTHVKFPALLLTGKPSIIREPIGKLDGSVSCMNIPPLLTKGYSYKLNGELLEETVYDNGMQGVCSMQHVSGGPAKQKTTIWAKITTNNTTLAESKANKGSQRTTKERVSTNANSTRRSPQNAEMHRWFLPAVNAACRYRNEYDATYEEGTLRALSAVYAAAGSGDDEAFENWMVANRKDRLLAAKQIINFIDWISLPENKGKGVVERTFKDAMRSQCP